MDFANGLKQLSGIVLQSRYLRIAVVVAVIVVGGLTAQWYFTKERPRTYLAKAYPLWSVFEGSVRSAQSANYEYDPYGVLEVNLDYVNSSAQDAITRFHQLRPPGKFKELHNQSLEMFRQYLATGNTIDASIKTEADYYYSLLTDLRNLFEFRRPSLAILGASYSDTGNYYESTWQDLELLAGEVDTLLTRVELARVPDRLKDFHQELLSLLRQTELLSRQGIEEYKKFQSAVRSGRHLAVAISLGTLRSRFESQAQGLDGGFNNVSAQSEVYRTSRTPEQYFRKSMENLARSQLDFELMLEYFSILSDTGDFYNRYSDFTPPQLSFFGQAGQLAGIEARGQTYARRWATYREMVRDLEDIFRQLENARPPSALASFHAEALITLREAVSAGHDALTQFDGFNNAITDQRLRNLDTGITRLSVLVSGNLDFAELWSLRDLSRGRAPVTIQFDAISQGWKEHLKRYDVMVATAAE